MVVGRLQGGDIARPQFPDIGEASVLTPTGEKAKGEEGAKRLSIDLMVAVAGILILSPLA